jgi:hypothetical protein
MKRRGFLRTLSVLAGAAPFVTEVFVRTVSEAVVSAPAESLIPSSFLVGYKGFDFIEAGYVYAPYMPFCVTNHWKQFDELIQDPRVKWEDTRIQYLIGHLT